MTNNSKKTALNGEKSKYVYLEAMRIVAIFFVIFNHTGNTGFFLFSQRPIGGLLFWTYLFVSIFCKFAVPLFFAISGALMLGRKDEPLKLLWKKRILKILMLLILYSLAYYLNGIDWNLSTFNWQDFFTSLYSGYTRSHLWYLYAYTAYLASLPFLRALVRNLETKYYYYMIAIALFLNGVLPVIEYFLWQGNRTLNGNMKLSWLISNIVLYPCIGYFMQNKLELDKIKRKIPILWALNIIGLLVCCYMTYYRGQITGVLQESESQAFHNSFALLNCMAVFITIRYLFEKIKFPKKVELLIVSMGSCTFGIYLLHLLIKDRLFMKNMLNAIIASGMNYMIAVFIQCFCVMLICYVITFVLLKIPILKKLVGG